MCDRPTRRLAVGFFDGIHLGHQAILRDADAALTFLDHPRAILTPTHAPDVILPLEERLRLMARPVTVLPFTPSLAALEPADFAARYLAGVRVVCGPDWRFGKGGMGSVGWLRAHGYEVSVVPPVLYRGERVSSTRIRASLTAGELTDVTAMLGRPYAVKGLRFDGKGEGRRAGYPTVNLTLPRVLLPKGVYVVTVEGCRAIANFGCAPTFRAAAWTSPVLEMHFPKDIPSCVTAAAHQLTVQFHCYLRPERTFETIADLQRQIALDCAALDT